MEPNATAIIARCNTLRDFWSPRNRKMKVWYRLVQMVDELKTDKMESFVGNDPRSMYNLILHMLDAEVPHRIEDFNLADLEIANDVASVSDFLSKARKDVATQFRRTNPRQSLNRTRIGFLIATGWYAEFSMITDDGNRAFVDIWNPAEVFPMWDMELGLAEVAHIFTLSHSSAEGMARRNNWKHDRYTGKIIVRDYWWVEVAPEFPFNKMIMNAVVVDSKLVKFGRTRFKKMPIYVAPVGGLPDTGAISEGTQLSTTSYNAGAVTYSERWKEEIGQSVLATNENIYRTWNKWWSFSLQLLRDTAQPRVFERSRSGKAIVRPEDVFRRGAIFRGGVDDSVEFLSPPPMPLELRSSQLDLEAMMQRGGTSWAMFGSVTGQMTAAVMSQIAASANQVMRPFHEAIINLNEDEDNDWLEDIKERGVRPYGWKYPSKLPDDVRVVADYEIEIPGDLVQRATVARMLNPDFRLSFSYVMKKLFPEVRNPMQEKAQVRSDMAEQHPTNAVIALVQYYRKQAIYLEKIGDSESAKLYELAAEAALATMGAGQGALGGGQPPSEPSAVPALPQRATPPL